MGKRQFLLEIGEDNQVRVFMFLDQSLCIAGTIELAYVPNLREAFVIVEAQAAVE